MSNTIDIREELGRNFLTYALDVDQNKAFPSVADGLAPGARAALWEMYVSKYFSNKPHIKSAKVAAGVIGRWWPHNADATYGTLVRMAQPFVENCLEIDFQGAVGNQIIGQDSAGSSRYTEMRLSKLAEDGMFYGINKNNVDMIWNYLQDEKMPKVLPSVFPRLLVNGHIGLGVGLSTTFTLHNLRETADVIIKYMETGEVDNENYYPDFPTGGIIINKDELCKINETGKGRVVVQAKYKVNGNQIIFYEFPYQVYIEPLIAKIKEAYNKELLPALEDVFNSSDKNSISITVTTNNIEQCLNELFANTPLQHIYYVNQNAIIKQVPEMVNLEKIVQVYVEHNVSCIKRETEFDINKLQERIEVLEGLSKALEDIDNVITIIKNSKNSAEAKNNLVNKYKFTEIQVNAILNMKLNRLANMERVAINKELQEKKEKCLELKEILNSEDKQKDILKTRLRELAKKYGNERRTEVTQKEIATKISSKKKKEAIVRDMVVIYTDKGYIKNVPLASYRKTTGEKFTVKGKTDEMILLFSSLGKVYRMKIGDIKECGIRDKGTAVGAVLKLDNNESILYVTNMNIDEKHPYVAFVSALGQVKKTDKTLYFVGKQTKTGVKCAGLKEGDYFIDIYETNGDYLTLFSSDNMALQFSMEEVSASGKTSKGCIGMKLNTGQTIVKSKLSKNSPWDKVPVRRRAGKGVIYGK